MQITNTDPVYPDFHNQTLELIRKNQEWEIIAEAKGDLNGDSKDDIAIILQSKNEIVEKRCETCELKTQKGRIFLLLLSKENILRVTSQNNQFIARLTEGGMTKDMNPELFISGGKLNLSYVQVRGEINYFFENSSEGIVLVKATLLSASHYIFKLNTVDLKNKILVTESRSDKDEPTKTTTIDLGEMPTKKLSELEMMGTWKVAEGLFL